ncbi:MAG: helix-turn-helix transcriptional regulator, partial [Spirochaetales bacterium]|nr:helix-turn-helix transcriptional regulator [Spirochaetales bacterium]
MTTDPFNSSELTDYQARTLLILEIAKPLLLRYGYSKVTVDDIAEQAKLGKGTIYLHWKSKEDLFYALLA